MLFTCRKILLTDKIKTEVRLKGKVQNQTRLNRKCCAAGLPPSWPPNTVKEECPL